MDESGDVRAKAGGKTCESYGGVGGGQAGWLRTVPSLLHKEREEDSGCQEVEQATTLIRRLFICPGDGDWGVFQ